MATALVVRRAGAAEIARGQGSRMGTQSNRSVCAREIGGERADAVAGIGPGGVDSAGDVRFDGVAGDDRGDRGVR